MFRSKYAKDSAETFVELVFSYQGKTYQVRRSPEYMAPKKRGTGLTLRKAEAQLIYPDERQPVTKAKDVTAAVEQLLGLSYDQFTQIAMIAQGDFQKLLLAGTVQRGEIFRQIFHTGLYQQIQMRLRDAAISRYKDYDEMRRSIAQYLDGVRFQTDAGTEAEEFLRLRKSKFEGKLERSLELLKLFIDRGERRENELRKQEEEVDREILTMEKMLNLSAQKRGLEQKRKLAREQLEKLLPELKKASEEAEKYKDADQRCEKLGLLIREKQEKLKKYQELEQLQKERIEIERQLENCKVQQKKIIRQEEQQQKEMEQLKTEREQLGNSELDLQKALTEKEKQTRRKKELNGLIAEIRRFQGLYDKTKEQQKKYQSACRDAQQQREYYQQIFHIFLDAQAGFLAKEKLRPGQPCPVCGSVHHPKLTQTPKEVPTEEQLKKQKKLTEAAEKAASDASVQAGEAAGLLQRCREELTEGFKSYAAQFLPQEETQEILRNELSDHELCLFVKNQESSVQTGLEEIQKQKKAYQDLLKKKEEFTTQSEQHAKEFQKLQISLEKRKSQLESIQEQLQNQLEEPVLTWIHEEDTRQRMKTNPELSQDHSSEAVYQKETCNVSQALLQGKKAVEWLNQQQNILEQKQKDLTALLEQRKLLEMQIGKTQTELTTITDQINQNQQQIAAEKSRYEQMQKQRENMEKELGERTKEEILSQIQLKTEEQKKLEIHYKTVTEAREVLEKRMTELDSVIASLTEQLKESISISAEELNAQKENFAQQKKSLSENRDEIHARLEINSDMYEKIRRQQTELLKTETRWKWMKSLSDTANGTITGKARIMLETYIQMQYFDRILARANIRLMTMSSGQYELVRRKENKSRVGKTGLELDVVDHYNGTVRSVKTLSGGETFQASLSLALGLSDEIQSSSGGIQLDTMFVDEGFGSLDEDALDQAIRALKDLSQGSRLVGIVSHVAELKERIDKKIIVTKKRTEDGVGSTICIEG